MKKLIIISLLVVLVVSALALAGRDEGWARPPHDSVGPLLEPMGQLEGEIISVSKEAVTIAIASDKEGQAKRIDIRIPEHQRAKFRKLLAEGLGQKAQLLCRKTEKGGWVLARIKGLEGDHLGQRAAWGHERGDWGKDRGPERPEHMRDRFRAVAERLRENPELREELRNLAKEDVEAFRQRIKKIHELGVDSIKGPHYDQGRGPGRGARGKGPGMFGPDRGRGERGGHGRGFRGRRRGPAQDPQIIKLERQSRELARQYQQAEGQDKEELAERLHGTLAEIFELKAKSQGQQVERLERQLDNLREQLEKREQNREAIIQKRYAQLTGQQDDLEW